MHPRHQHTPRTGARCLIAVLIAGLGASLIAAAPVGGIDGPADTSTPAPAVESDAVGADHVVAMGAVDPAIAPTDAPPASEGRTDRFEYLAYYPDTIQIHRGDVVRFDRRGGHTATFTPDDEPRVPLWRRDETEDVAAIDGFLPSHDGCGGQGQDPCVFTGDERFNTGWASMAVAVDAPEGSYDYYCAIHGGMKGTIEVVDDATPVASPEEVEQARKDAIAEDTAAGEALIAANQTPEFEQVDDHRRWFVKAGDVTDDGRVAVLRFLPSNLEIAPGDEVEYVASGADVPGPGLDEISAEVHTVTFPNDPANSTLGVGRYILPACDPDDPSADLPGVPTGPVGFVTTDCPAGSTFEYLMLPNAWQHPMRPPEDVVLPGSPYDSGLLVQEGAPCRTGCDPWTEEPFPSTTAANFPAEGTYSYVCLVHPTFGMSGGIEVVEP